MTRAIIIGGGKMVYFLARQFVSKNYHVTIINREAHEARNLARNLKATIIHGDGSVPRILEEAGARQTDVLLSLTPQDQDNLVACQLAQKMFDVPKTVALVNDPENEAVFHRLGVTTTFSATQILIQLIEEQVNFEEITSFIPIAEGRVNVTEVILSDESPAINRSLQYLKLPEGALIASIIRGEEMIVPTGSHRLHVGDRLLLVSQPENHGEALRLLAGDEV
jgi:trk system potassium uptake protein TrkA